MEQELSSSIFESRNQIYLIAGATANVGHCIVKALISRGKRVRLLSEKKLNESFTEDEIKKFEKVVECNLEEDKDFKQKLEELFLIESSSDQFYVISSLNYQNEEESVGKNYSLITNQRLIDAAIQNKVKKFCLLSSSHVTRPFSFTSLCRNLHGNYKQWHRVLVEDYLRKSQLDYLIIRPNKLKFETEPTAFTISQGDKLEGEINVSTLGRLVVDTLNDPWIPACTSYECVSTPDQLKQSYQYIQGLYHLHSETTPEKRLPNHKVATRLVLSAFWSIIFSMGYLVFRFGKKFNWSKFTKFIMRIKEKFAL